MANAIRGFIKCQPPGRLGNGMYLRLLIDGGGNELIMSIYDICNTIKL